jgi:hypothetical protein
MQSHWTCRGRMPNFKPGVGEKETVPLEAASLHRERNHRPSHPLSRFQAGIVGLCALVVVLDGFDTQCIGFLAPPIAKTLNVPLKAFGPVFGFGLVGLMISSMTMGPVADRWGRKWPLVLLAHVHVRDLCVAHVTRHIL